MARYKIVWGNFLNKRQLLIQRNNTARLLELHSKRERNSVRINIGNSLKHEVAKFYLNWCLRRNGSETVTEAIFRGFRARGDVLELDTGTCYEILQSETKEKFFGKSMYYPKEVQVVSCEAQALITKMLKELGE